MIIHIGDKVETINGVGIVEDILDHRSQGGELTYAVCTGRQGFGGDRDNYTSDEVSKICENFS